MAAEVATIHGQLHDVLNRRRNSSRSGGNEPATQEDSSSTQQRRKLGGSSASPSSWIHAWHFWWKRQGIIVSEKAKKKRRKKKIFHQEICTCHSWATSRSSVEDKEKVSDYEDDQSKRERAHTYTYARSTYSLRQW